MALLLHDVVLELDEEESRLPERVATQLGRAASELDRFEVVRRAIDARRKSRIRRVFTVRFSCRDEEQLLTCYPGPGKLEEDRPAPLPTLAELTSKPRVLVVGMGPAGLFAALQLARCGARVTLVERGSPVEQRVHEVRRFWTEGTLDPESNVQFGEGGAGTFSDGKLTTRINHPWSRLVLQTLVELGAPAEILVEARPHIGTDRLRLVLIRARQLLRELGVELRYRCRLTGLVLHAGRVCGGRFANGEELPCEALLLAPGHSARDTYAMLQASGVQLEAKPFAIGLRVEHPTELINRIQYGTAADRLPAADYKLAWNDPQSGRGVYSFCMCPGGEVVVSASEPNRLVVNGMSSWRRDRPFSNSALVVSVTPADFPGRGVLAGVELQRDLERRAFLAGGGNYFAPAQNLLAYLGLGRGPVRGSSRPGVAEADLGVLLPAEVTGALRRALPVFDRKMRGFVSAEAVLIGVETRTSAPLRILRGSDGQSLSHPGLYPAGEGAGYAGGIMSAALDGLRAAEQLIHNQTDTGQTIRSKV